MFTLQDIAQEMLAAFDLDFGDSGLSVQLSPDAPPFVPEIAERVFGSRNPDDLVRLFEALSVVSEADDPALCEIDEKICSLASYRTLLKELEALLAG